MTVPRLTLAPEPGKIHWQWFHGHKFYYAYYWDGSRVLLPGVPIGSETDADVITRFADALEASAPPLRAVDRPARPHACRVLPLFPPAPPRPVPA